jgi:hypothetical protein
MSNPYLAAFLDVRDRGSLTPLLDAHDADRRGVEALEQGLARLTPAELATAARDFTGTEYSRLGFPSGLEPLLDQFFGRDYSDTGISDVTRALLSVADVALGALPRELDRLTLDPDLPEASGYTAFVEGLTYLAIAGLLEKRIGTERQASYIFAARSKSMSTDRAVEHEREAVAKLAAYEQQVRAGTLLPRP